MTEKHPKSVVLTRVGKNYEATLLEGRLKAHGIDATVEQLFAYDDAGGNAGIRVWVPQAKHSQALEILDELQQARANVTDEELDRQALEADKRAGSEDS